VLDRLRDHLDKSQLIPSGAKLVVGYSGGADSTCLVHLLKVLGFEIIAAHLHHGQREEADTELKLCEAFCQELDVPFVSGNASVPRMAHDLKIGVEEAGRLARYNFLEQVAKRFSCPYIVTAHTRTDSVETILFNLARGTGMRGLTGVPAQRGEIVRPLLPFSRDETRAYCAEHQLWFHDDPSNSELEFSRARIRHRVSPEFALINPNFEASMMRMAEIVDEEDRFLNGAAAAALERAMLHLNGELSFLTKDVEIAFDRDQLSQLPSVLFRRAMRLAAKALASRLDFDQAIALEAGFSQQSGGSITTERGEVVFEWDAEKLHVRQMQPTEPFRFKVTLPGETESEEFGWKIAAFEAPASETGNKRGSFQVEVNRQVLQGELYFRSAQPNDTIQPLGFDGTRKLSDVLSEAKLTRAARARLPIICDFLGPIWAPGVCLSHRIDKDATMERVLVLTFEPII
jgi:tRNA(Ile)-lysidine synthase